MATTRLGLTLSRFVQRRTMASTPAAQPTGKNAFPPLEKVMLAENFEARQHAE
ncbi:hypothetical protein HK102_006932, partial [Quaeritorhiza haematococci]